MIMILQSLLKHGIILYNKFRFKLNHFNIFGYDCNDENSQFKRGGGIMLAIKNIYIIAMNNLIKFTYCY